MELSERKKSILTAVVDEYIHTAEPVGSKRISELSCVSCSPATIRNELSELVNLGYLEQPHTSAGRIPTPRGYRLYVNELMDRHRLSMEEAEQINRELGERMERLDDLLSEVGALASQMTNYPALATSLSQPAYISRFDLIYVDANTFIIVAMLGNNTVENKLVRLPISVGQDMIMRLSAVFNANFTNISEAEITPLTIRSAERATDDTMGLTSVIASFAIEVLSKSGSSGTYISGTNRLLSQPEYRDPERAHEIMSYLNSMAAIPESVNGDTNGADVQVFIGPENLAEELRDSSLIVASYNAGDGTRGLIGVVGPTRMDYSTVAAKLGLIAQTLSVRLSSGLAPPKGLDNKLIIKGDIGEKR